MASVKPTQETLDAVSGMNLGKKDGKAAFLIFKISGDPEEITVDHKEPFEKDAKSVEKMMEKLDDEDCRFILIDYWHMKGDIAKNSMALINWVPDNAPTMPGKARKAGKAPKTVYGANFEAFAGSLPCQCEKKCCTDISDITEFLTDKFGEEVDAC
eukprot:g3126.t1